MLRVVLLFVFSLSFVLGGMASRGTPEVFWDLPSALIVFFPSIGLCIASHGWKNFRDLFIVLHAQPLPARAEELALVAHSCGRNFFLFGFIGMLIGGIHMLREWSDIHLDVLPTSFGVMLLTFLYGVCAKALVFVPLEDRYRGMTIRKQEE